MATCHANMDSSDLKALLAAHVAADEKEAADLSRMREAAASLPEPFSRHQPGAHFTGSAVVVTPDGLRTCLVHHAKLKRWLQPGGHADVADGGDMSRTALREAAEETGCRVVLHPNAPRPLDVDVHAIPARKDEAEHLHLDVRYLVVAENPEALAHDPAESFGARWLGWHEALAAADEPPLRRMLEKARACAQSKRDTGEAGRVPCPMCEKSTPGTPGVPGTCVHCGADFHLGAGTDGVRAEPAQAAPTPARRRPLHLVAHICFSVLGVAVNVVSVEVSSRRSHLAQSEAYALFVCSPFLLFLVLGLAGRGSTGLVFSVTAGLSVLTAGFYALAGFDFSEMGAMLQILWTLVLLGTAAALGAMVFGTAVVRGGRREG